MAFGSATRERRKHCAGCQMLLKQLAENTKGWENALSKITIVHLTDIHIHGADDQTLSRFDSIFPILRPVLVESKNVIVLVSGDIAYSGAKAEYDAVLVPFQKLASDIENMGARVEWILVPGNHDGAFKNSGKARLSTIDGVIRDGENGIDESVIDIATLPQAEYFAFEEVLTKGCVRKFKDRLLGIRQIDIGDKVLSFWEFNASWMSRVPEVQGQLVFPVSNYDIHLRDAADIRIGVLHHPLNWYIQSSYHPFREMLTKNFSAVLSGHEHIQNAFINTPLINARNCLFLEGGALGPHSKNEAATFSTLTVDVETGSYEHRQYSYDAKTPCFYENESSRSTSKFALAGARDFELTTEYRERLEEMAAPFSHPNRETLRLSDVYVEPIFSSFSIEDASAPPVDFYQFVEGLEKNKYILVRGDEHQGKTSLLTQLVYKALDNGWVPVILSPKDVSNGTTERRERAVNETIEMLYGTGSVENYKRLDFDRRVALVDDLERLGSNPESYVRALSFLNANFARTVITVSDRFDASLLGSSELAQNLGRFDEYRMKGFSYSMRSDLIRRWYGLNTSLDKPRIDAKIHEAQTQIDHAVAKALVPSTAFNTLMILQALEATQKSQTVDAGVAQHYDMLIRRRLSDSGATPKSLDGTYAYLSHLAWRLKRDQASSLDKEDIDAFNDWFRSNIHNADTTALLGLLVKARIISDIDGSYQFKHPSARYFFLANHIAENLDEDPEAKRVATEACQRLYQKDNGNLVVFLASKTASRWIIKEVATVLAKLLKELPCFNVINDSRTLNGWVSKTAKLAVSALEDDDGRQKQQRQREEEAQQLEQALPDSTTVEDVSELDVFAQINLVFKTSEILGLILKAKFGSLNTKVKEDLLRELFDGPLRAISFFLKAINDQPDALIEYLSSSWADKIPNSSTEQRTKLAQRFVYYSLGAYSQALIQRQGEISGSPDLASYINSFVNSAVKREKDGEGIVGSALTYRLVGVASRLSYPGTVPANEIERLSKDLQSNPFGFTLLQGLVANHLYMFPVEYSLRQRLAQAVNIDLKQQLAKEVTGAEEKVTQSRSFTSRNPKSLLARLTQSYLTRNDVVMKRIGVEAEQKKERRSVNKPQNAELPKNEILESASTAREVDE